MLENFQVAIPTAFNKNEDLDIKKTIAFAEHLIKNNIKSLLVCGSTGEQHSMSLNEKL